MYLTDGKHKITVPKHDPIKRGTLLSIIYQSGLTKEEFFEAAKGVIDSVSALKKLRRNELEDLSVASNDPFWSNIKFHPFPYWAFGVNG
jgi:hypothetical protein